MQPLVVICGTTGVGKSLLAVELALAMGKLGVTNRGRVINADAMQVYRGLDILTNKIPSEEQKGVEHLLMSFKQPSEQYVVGEWVKDAVSAIDETHELGQQPIVVGGTSYWIQHLLFLNSLPSFGLERGLASTPSSQLQTLLGELPQDLLETYTSLPTSPPSATLDPEFAFKLHKLLSMLDPPMAARWHWKDTRKVLRDLKLIKEHGRPASDVVTESDKFSLLPRYRTLIFWLYADPTVLNQRIDGRVDKMLQQGLLDEIRGLHELFQAEAAPEHHEYTLGLYQSIGLREFEKYITASEPTQNIYDVAVEDMKRNTRKYARTQIKWIKNKLIPAVAASREQSEGHDQYSQDDVQMFLLDATELGRSWEDRVLEPAMEILQKFLHKESLPDPVSISPLAEAILKAKHKPTSAADILATNRKLVCPICTVDPDRPVMIEGGETWEKHQKTRNHRKMMNAGKERPLNVRRSASAENIVANLEQG